MGSNQYVTPKLLQRQCHLRSGAEYLRIWKQLEPKKSQRRGRRICLLIRVDYRRAVANIQGKAECRAIRGSHSCCVCLAEITRAICVIGPHLSTLCFICFCLSPSLSLSPFPLLFPIFSHLFPCYFAPLRSFKIWVCIEPFILFPFLSCAIPKTRTTT